MYFISYESHNRHKRYYSSQITYGETRTLRDKPIGQGHPGGGGGVSQPLVVLCAFPHASCFLLCFPSLRPTGSRLPRPVALRQVWLMGVHDRKLGDARVQPQFPLSASRCISSSGFLCSVLPSSSGQINNLVFGILSHHLLLCPSSGILPRC